jgi:hydrogenase maturation protease
VDRVLVVGCAPADVAERMGLSEPVAAAVDAAVRLVSEVVAAEVVAAEVGVAAAVRN